MGSSNGAIGGTPMPGQSMLQQPWHGITSGMQGPGTANINSPLSGRVLGSVPSVMPSFGMGLGINPAMSNAQQAIGGEAQNPLANAMPQLGSSLQQSLAQLFSQFGGMRAPGMRQY